MTTVDVSVTIACDSCRDATADLARCAIDADSRFALIDGRWDCAGGTRRAAAAHALAPLTDDHAHTWLLSTDADTIVPVGWFTSVVDRAHQGADAIAGVVELIRDQDWSPRLDSVFSVAYDVGEHRHDHVHAANLAVRRDAYEAVGGYRAISCGEDQMLWADLKEAGYTCVPDVSWRVATSARVQSRAHGGFGDALADQLACAEAAGS